MKKLIFYQRSRSKYFSVGDDLRNKKNVVISYHNENENKVSLKPDEIKDLIKYLQEHMDLIEEK